MTGGFYDLHAHILPKVDDGARSLEEAIDMAGVAAEQGTRVILATPHRRDVTEGSSVSHVQDLVAGLNSELETAGTDLHLALGMENHVDPDLPDDLSSGKALAMGSSRYVLVELPFFGYPEYVEEVLFQVQVQGLTPVLAHPERIEAVQRNPELLASFVERGMQSQVTAGSIVGHFGGKVKRLTHSLLRRRMVHIIASDTHYARGPRSPKLTGGLDRAAQIVGQESAYRMVVDTPQAILEDLPVEVEAPRIEERPRRWWWPWGG